MDALNIPLCQHSKATNHVQWLIDVCKSSNIVIINWQISLKQTFREALVFDYILSFLPTYHYISSFEVQKGRHLS